MRMVLVGQHESYCHSHRDSRQTHDGIQIITERLRKESHGVIQSVMKIAGGSENRLRTKLVPRRKRWPRSHGGTEYA